MAEIGDGEAINRMAYDAPECRLRRRRAVTRVARADSTSHILRQHTYLLVYYFYTLFLTEMQKYTRIARQFYPLYKFYH
ncbi:hypothetical protein M446_5882 [Methylobacterium sp. 4-46]|uniref:hypothetical protein n=1 Tax=unclassified Methylobacterium TaxID=2615210 RepID=UPI000165CE34|nr:MULTISPECIES: hypothetical protein [Methylobacterium]ACA20169.1 hypothetical protein M446_5882 [Methylobacterium sp. 4-46]WFT79347.1 hypothetical protein QA634_29695 [Methylobacterium nodulans]